MGGANAGAAAMGGAGNTSNRNAAAGASASAAVTSQAANSGDDAGLQFAQDGGSDAGQATDDIACAFDFVACLLADPLDYADCVTANAQHCDLLANSGSATPAADSGMQPSVACTLQEADCISNNPLGVADCVTALQMCTL
jgi:hypothetical protein